MIRRAEPGRRRRLGGETGDPLDGLVNLFDIGIVLAIAFLIAGLASTVDQESGELRPRQPQTQTQSRDLPQPTNAQPATGQGQAVGTVYRLADGRLIYTEGSGSP